MSYEALQPLTKRQRRIERRQVQKWLENSNKSVAAGGFALPRSDIETIIPAERVDAYLEQLKARHITLIHKAKGWDHA